MVSLNLSVERTLETLYAASARDVAFGEVLAACPCDDEDSLADLIELDGRYRLATRRPIALSRYTEAVPGLDAQTVALDAAIDVTLRSMSVDSKADPAAIDALVAAHPEVEHQIREAAALGYAMLATTPLRRRLEVPERRPLPCDFGPAGPDGAARYQLQRFLGAGGWGEVYLATDRQLSEPDRPAAVAVKLLRWRGAGPWARQRFIEEATKARRVTHDHVARVLDRGASPDGEDYIVYEHVSGGDLQSAFASRGRPMPPREAAALVAKVARAVQAAHIAGVVHCDLKPGNILLTETGEPKVTDFGIAVRAGQAAPALPQAEADRPLGNLAFIAPEQYRGEEGALGPAADVFALGSILYFLLTAEYPNGRTPREIALTHNRHEGRRDPPSARVRCRAVDRDLDLIARRAMAPAPGDRHCSAGALADDLEAWARREPIAWTRPGLPRTAALWVRRRPLVSALLALVVVSSVIGAAVAQRLTSIAREQRVQALLAENRRLDTRAELLKIYEFVKTVKKERMAQDLLPMVMAFEWLHGPAVLGSPDDRTALWRDRMDIVRRMIAQAEREGRSGSLESLVWQTTLGFWLTSGGEWEEAEPILDRNLQGWSAILDPDDGWLDQVRMIRAAAAVARLRTTPPGPERDAALKEAAAVLKQEREVFPHRIAGTPVHLLVLRTLVDLHRPGMLNEPAQSRRFERRLDEVDD